MALNVSLSFPGPQATGFDVEHLELREAMSELSELVLLVLSTDPAIDMTTLVGQPVMVALADEPLLPQLVLLVRRARQLTSEPTGASRYELTAVPPLWLTTRRTDHRIFQDLTVVEIVRAVLAAYGGRIPMPVDGTSGNHPKREYTVQYGETDFDFVMRLLADEGIATFFDHASSSTPSAWTFVDDTTVFTPSLSGAIPFVAASALIPKGPFVSGVAVTSNVEVNDVSLRDYDFEKPEFILESRTPPLQQQALDGIAIDWYRAEVGRARLQPEIDEAALQLRDAIRVRVWTASCTTSFALAAGTRFSLVGYPRSDVDRDYLVVRARLVLDARGPATSASRVLECVDAAALFRPMPRAKPRIWGTQTAFVVGAPGEEIDVDEYGRVQVEFRWDRRDLHTGGITRRIRVSQGWAGAGFGFVMLPRVNEEVVVAYLDGDPDEPIVVGRVHNAFVTTPLKLPAEKTRSIWRSRSTPNSDGFNAIMMEDAAGEELLALRAERDFRSDTGRNALTVVGNDQTLRVGGDVHVHIKGTQRSDADKMIGRTTDYKLDAKTVTMNAEKIGLNASDTRRDTSTNHFIDTGGLWVKASSIFQVMAGKILLQGDSEVKLVSGGSSITITPGGIAITSSGPVSINGAVVKLNC